ncbi:MAG: M48 family metalloprotease [Bacteroidetes bacterium]|nr:M48 family metalloprotease [Bacteroidota bacterium]
MIQENFYLKASLALFLAFAFVCNPPEPIDPDTINKEFFTVQEEKDIGQTIKEAISQNPTEFPVLSEGVYSDAYDYVKNLLESCTNTSIISRRTDFDWDVTLLRDDNIQTAFIIPGGHLYIYTGLLKNLFAENQLFSLIAHELYYAETDYLIQRIKAEYSGIVLGDILLDKEVAQMEEITTFLKTITLEEEIVMKADSFAVELVCPFSWDANGMKTWMEQLDSLNIEVQWLEFQLAEKNSRIEHISNYAKDCGEDEPTFEERYIHFKTNLLP